MQDALHNQRKREPLLDFYRSIFMLFVFFHHYYLTFPGTHDYWKYLNPFAELFVALAGFMIGYIYLKKNKDMSLVKKGVKVLLCYYFVAIPIALFVNLVNGEGSILQTVLQVISLNVSVTWIQILKFYGVLFIILPIILRLYRRSPLATVILSISLFVVSTLTYDATSFESPFITYTLITLLQWQLFFIVGIVLGDRYQQKKLNIGKIFNVSLLIGLVSFLIQFLIYAGMPDEKVPYHFPKLLNSLYLAPVYLYLLTRIYRRIRGTHLERFISVIGKYSLTSFAVSEIVRFWLIYCPISLLKIELSEMNAVLVSLLFTILIVFLIFLIKENSLKKNDIHDFQIERG